MQFRKYTKEQLIEAVAGSTSIRQTLIKLDVAPQGGNYLVIKNYIEKLSIDISHFTGQASNKGKIFGPKRPIDDYLSNEHEISSHSLKLRLLREGYFDHECQGCGGTTWGDQKIPLELHHIDGNSKNNSLENLSLVCPNCHALTDNYRGRNRDGCNENSKSWFGVATARGFSEFDVIPQGVSKPVAQINKFNASAVGLQGRGLFDLAECLHCKDKFVKNQGESKFCSRKCYHQSAKGRPNLSARKVDRPSKEYLEKLISESNYSAIGRKYGVSDNAVRKWARSYGIIPSK